VHEVASADRIVVGRVTRVRDESGAVTQVSTDARPEDDQLRLAEVDVIRTLAGEATSGPLSVLFLQGKLPSRPWMTLDSGQVALLLLRAAGDRYVPVAPAGRALPALPDGTTLAADAPPDLRVAHELEQVVLRADPASEVPLIVRAATARLQLRRPVDLARLETPPLQEPPRRAAWVAFALAAEQEAALETVPSLFIGPASPDLEVLQSLVVQQIEQIQSPTARPRLVALLWGNQPAVARAAAVALRQIHDPAAVADLVRALDHADVTVRYQAVMGLSELEPGVDAGPSIDTYRANEEHYRQLWKRWWQQRGTG
jgi:hypothetical protein